MSLRPHYFILFLALSGCSDSSKSNSAKNPAPETVIWSGQDTGYVTTTELPLEKR